MKLQPDYSLYVITDRDLMSSSTIEASVSQAIAGGATCIQLREKDVSTLEFFQLAERVKKITESSNVPLIINDRLDIALAVDAAGLHVGQKDMPCSILRKILGPDKIIGVSVANVEQAKIAMADGADYLGIGAMYPTGTKDDAAIVSKGELKKILDQVNLPAVVIGGINENTISDFAEYAIDGIAVISAVISQEDIAQAAGKLKNIFKESICHENKR